MLHPSDKDMQHNMFLYGLGMFPSKEGNMSNSLVEFHTDDGDECNITCNITALRSVR